MNIKGYVRTLPTANLSSQRALSYRLHLDLPLLVMLTALLIAGLVVLYSASGGDTEYVQRQGIRILVAYSALFLIAQLDPRTIQRWGGAAYLGGLLLLVTVVFYGVTVNGAQRWLRIPGVITFQPSEIMKLAVPIMVAWYLARHELPPRFKHLCVALILIIVPTVLILQQPDLGTSLLIISSGLFVIFLAGMSWWYIIAGLLSAAASFPLLWLFVLRDYQKRRILTMFDPEQDRLGAGWNIIQSKTAIGSGGWSGKGFMEGTQSQLDFLPESNTDFIVAVLAEEFGLMGMLLILALYLAISARCLMIAIGGRDTFGRLLAGGLTLVFFIYVFVNVGMVSGILPVVGVPLPLVSYGGTSIVTLMTGFGIIMSVATHKNV
ncbi:MAG: rod shape-determining protein RodA [Natronospirillum sp.]